MLHFFSEKSVWGWKMCFQNLSATRSLEIQFSLDNSILPIIYLRFVTLEIIDRVSSWCFLNRIYLSEQFPCCSLCYPVQNCQIQHWYRTHDSNQHSLASYYAGFVLVVQSFFSSQFRKTINFFWKKKYWNRITELGDVRVNVKVPKLMKFRVWELGSIQ